MSPVHTELPQVFVVSLASSVERRARITAQLDQIGLPFRFIDGVVGKDLQPQEVADAYNSRKRQLLFGKDMTPGELGCLLGHRRAYETMLQENLPSVLVLEDDALIDGALVDVLRAVMALDAEWDIVRFLCRPKNYALSRAILPLNEGYSLTHVGGLPGGAYGYLVSARAAKVLLHHTKRAFMPVDTLQGYTGLTGLTVYGVKPSPILCDDDVPSTIGDQRFSRRKQIDGAWRLAYYVTRLGLKIYEMAFKKWIWLVGTLYVFGFKKVKRKAPRTVEHA